MSRIYFERVYCRICDSNLGFFKKDIGIFVSNTILCPQCEDLQILSKNGVLENLEYEEQFSIDELRRYFRGSSISRNIRLLMNLRESLSLPQDSVNSNPTQLESGLVVFTLEFFIKANIGIKILLEEIGKGSYFYNDNRFDSQMLVKNLVQIQDVRNIRYDIKHNNCVIIKVDDDFVPFQFQISKEYEKSLRQYGLVSREENPNDYESLSDSIYELEDKTDIQHNLYQLGANILTGLYMNNKEDESRPYSFHGIDTKIKQIIHDAIVIFREVFKDSFGETQEDLQNNKNFYTEIDEKKFEESIKDLIVSYTSSVKHDSMNISQVEQTYQTIKNLIVYSAKNNSHSPIFIQDLVENKIYFGKHSLLLYQQLVWASIEWNSFNTNLNEWNNKTLIQKVVSEISKFNIKTYDEAKPKPILLTEIKNKKVDGFEIDLLGIKDEFLFLIELKTFKPTPFMDKDETREKRFERCLHFENQIFNSNKALEFFSKEFQKKFSDSFREIDVRKKNKNNNYVPVKLKFKANYSPKYLVPIYLNQLNELPNPKDFKINLVIWEEFSEFLKRKDRWKKYTMI